MTLKGQLGLSSHLEPYLDQIQRNRELCSRRKGSFGKYQITLEGAGSCREERAELFSGTRESEQVQLDSFGEAEALQTPVVQAPLHLDDEDVGLREVTQERGPRNLLAMGQTPLLSFQHC